MTVSITIAKNPIAREDCKRAREKTRVCGVVCAVAVVRAENPAAVSERDVAGCRYTECALDRENEVYPLQVQLRPLQHE